MFSNNYILTKDFLFSYPQTIIHDLKIVQIDKARELGYTNNELERWLKFIAAKSSNERADIAKGDELLVELNEWIHKYVADDKMQEELNKWDLEIAENKGYEQGVEQGIEQKAMEIAKTMLAKDYSMDEIADISGLTKEEIEKLKEDN